MRTSFCFGPGVAGHPQPTDPLGQEKSPGRENRARRLRATRPALTLRCKCILGYARPGIGRGARGLWIRWTRGRRPAETQGCPAPPGVARVPGSAPGREAPLGPGASAPGRAVPGILQAGSQACGPGKGDTPRNCRSS